MRDCSSLIIVLVVVCLGVCRAKVYDRCELARELKDMRDVIPEHVSTWVCIAYYESRFDTSAVGRLNGDWSWDHGLFQLSDRYWCGRDRVGGACYMPCSALRDQDITDDMRCMKIIFEEHQRLSGNGFKAWAVHGRCQGARAERFVAGCFDGYELDANNVD